MTNARFLVTSLGVPQSMAREYLLSSSDAYYSTTTGFCIIEAPTPVAPAADLGGGNGASNEFLRSCI